MTAAEAISVMTPAVAIGNAISIIFAGIIVKVLTDKKWNGQGALMQATTVDPKELEISPEMQAKREKIDVKNLGIGLCYLSLDTVIESFSLTYLVLCLVTCVGAFFGAGLVGKWVGFYPVEAGITAGLCMSNMGGTGDVAVLSASDRMELMPFAQISSRLGGAIILIIGSLLLSTLGGLL